MLSGKLVQLIEANWEEIASRLIADVRKHPDLANLSRKTDGELREWCQEILRNLGYLLVSSKKDEVRRRFEVLRRMRFEEKVPLHEAVLRFHLLKDKILGFVREQGYPMTAMELYAEEELAQRMGRFFDACVYHVVRGYEAAFRRELRAAS